MKPNLFSEREQEVIDLLLQRKSNKQIASALGISVRAVEFHLTNIYARLGAASRTEAALKLAATGLRESAVGSMRDSTVAETARSSENGKKSVPWRVLMNKFRFIVGGVGLGLALIILLGFGVLWLYGPVTGEVFSSVTSYPALEMSATPAAPPLGLPPQEVNQARDVALIRQIMGRPDLQLTFDSVQGLANASGRSAALYTDDAETAYYVDIKSGRLAAIEPHFTAHPEIPADQVKSMDELRDIATQFAQANSARLPELSKSLVHDEGCKGSLCFFRWDARNLQMDWSGTDWAMMPPFLQIGLLTNGQIATYNNTLDLYETTVAVEPPQPTLENILGGGTVQDGPFTFDLRLYRDPRLTRAPVAPSMYSDMEGIGAYMYWFYMGSEPVGPVETYLGTLPQLDQLLQATFDSIRLGSSGGRNGGILLPGGSFITGESRPGDHVRVALKVTTQQGDYGALLAFNLRQGDNGLEPADISVEVLRDY